MLTLEGSAASSSDWLIRDASWMWFSAPQIKIEIELALGDGESHSCHFRSVWFCLQCRMQQIPCVAVQRWREVRCSSRVQSESQKRSTPLEDLVWATPDHAGLLREIREQPEWLLLCWKKKSFFFAWATLSNIVLIFHSKAVFMWFQSFSYPPSSSGAALHN